MNECWNLLSQWLIKLLIKSKLNPISIIHHRNLTYQYIFPLFNSVSHVIQNVVVVSLEINHQIAVLNESRATEPACHIARNERQTQKIAVLYPDNRITEEVYGCLFRTLINIIIIVAVRNRN
jgi:hypothetical protein